MQSTDERRIDVRPGRTVDELIDRVLATDAAVRATPGFLETIASEFALPYGHARLAIARAAAWRGADDGAAARGAAGASTSASASPRSRWPALAAAFEADTVAELRARLSAPAFAAAASEDERRAAALWLEAVDGRKGPAEPVAALVVERLVALAATTLELDDGATVRGAVLRRTGALAANCVAATRARRGEEAHALDGSPLWFDAVTLLESTRALAITFARAGDDALAHDALGLHCAVATGLLGHCHERVAAAMLGFALSAAARDDHDTALAAVRELTAQLADDVVARCELAGGAGELENVLALRRLDEALDLQQELAGDDPAIGGLRGRVHALLGGPHVHTGTRAALLGADPQAALTALLRHHQLEVTADGDWLRLPRGCRARARFQALDEGVVQLDVVFEPWLGTAIVESCAGFGTTPEARRADAWHTFTLGSLHVLLAAFLYVDDVDVRRTSWDVDGVTRAVTLGDVVGRGSTPAQGQLDGVVRTIVESSALPEGTHWIRAFLVQNGDELVAREVLLDNETWEYGEAKLAEVSWPAADGAGSARVFLVVQGGVDVGRAVAELATAGERDDDELRAAMIARGVDAHDAALLVGLVPIAFGRMLLARSGVGLADRAALVGADGGKRGELVLADEPIFEEASWLAERGTLAKEEFLAIAMRSPEVAAFEDLAGRGEDPADYALPPAAIIVP